MEKQPQNAELGNYSSFSDYLLDYLNTINHLNRKLFILIAWL